MSLDLRILVVLDCGGFCISTTALELNGNGRVLEKVLKESKKAYPKPDSVLHSYFSRNEEGESCYGPVEEDSYGDPIMFIHAKDMREILLDKNIFDNLDNYGVAAAMYIKHLRDKQILALYWH